MRDKCQKYGVNSSKMERILNNAEMYHLKMDIILKNTRMNNLKMKIIMENSGMNHLHMFFYPGWEVIPKTDYRNHHF
jgi:hypothetical protein